MIDLIWIHCVESLFLNEFMNIHLKHASVYNISISRCFLQWNYLLFSWHLSCRWNKCDSQTHSEETRTIKNIENGEVCTELKVSVWSWVPSSVLSIPTYSIIIGALSSFEVPTEPTSNSFLEMIRQFFKLVFRNVIATERNHF